MFTVSRPFLINFFILVFGISTFVNADPIRIVSGVVDRSRMSIVGTNSTNIGVFSEIPLNTELNNRWMYVSGSTVTPVIDGLENYNGTGNADFRTPYGGSIIVNGVTYQDAHLGIGSSAKMTFTPLESIKCQMLLYKEQPLLQ